MREVFALFGEGIHESLQRTMGDYLESTSGDKSNSKMELWEKARAAELRCDNNPAERPFGIIKALLENFPSMSLSNLGRLAHARY